MTNAKVFRAWIALALALAGLAVTKPTSALAVTLIYSNDVLGDIEPCGCRENPLGGFLRKAGLLSKLSQSDQKAEEFLQVDGGNLLFQTDEIPEALKKQAEIQATYVLKMMKALGHQAVVPGPKDFALGAARLKTLVKNAKIDFLAANLKSKNGSPLFPASKVYRFKEFRVGVIGIVGDALMWPKELKTENSIKAAKKEIQVLKGKVDLIVALTHQGHEADQALAKAVTGIDLIVGGNSQSFLQSPINENSTLIFQSSFRNQYIGVLPINRPVSKPLDLANHRLVALDIQYEQGISDQRFTEVKTLVEQFKASIAQANNENEIKLDAASSRSKKVSYQTFPKCAECHLKQFDFWRKTQHSNALEPLLKSNQAGNLECLGCHSLGLGQAGAFKKITQAGEMSTGPLEASPTDTAEPAPAKKKYLTLEALAPHLRTLHEAKTLDQNVKKTLGSLHKSWVPVQCENCHQAGGEHPFAGSYTKTVAQTACLKCHMPDRAPGWYQANGKLDSQIYEQKRLSITCPSGELDYDDSSRN